MRTAKPAEPMTQKESNQIRHILKEVRQQLAGQSITAWLVGGFVRDSLYNRSTADIDLAVTADALKLGPALAAAMGGKYVLLDETHRVCRIVFSGFPAFPHLYLDLSTIETDIQADLARRDFTIDAMAIDLLDYLNQAVTANPADLTAQMPVIDPFNGRQDLHAKSIRALNDDVFRSDPARVLRAFRLAAELDFVITPHTRSLIKRDKTELGRLAGERTHDELIKLLASSRAGETVRLMDELGVLTTLIPELEASRDVEQPKEHHWDVLNHALECVRTAGCILRQGLCSYISAATLTEIPWSPSLAEHFSSPVTASISHAVMVKLAALLHDIAKPATRIVDKERIRFFGHNEQGAESVIPALERLRFSNREIRLVECMVRHHMRPTQMSNEGLPTRRAVYRYYRDTGVAAIDILYLSLADHLAARGPHLDTDQWHWHLGQVKYTLSQYNRDTTLRRTPHLINGHDLINELGLSPGPQLRELLELAREAQADGEVKTRGEALSYIKNRLIYKKQN